MTSNRATSLTFLVCTLVTGASLAQGDEADSKGWQTSVSLGTVVVPTYKGDDDLIVAVVPDIRVEYSDRFFFSPITGSGYNLLNTGSWRAGPIARLDFGRGDDAERPLAVSRAQNDELRGLGDLDATVEAGAFIEYTSSRLRGTIEARQGVSGHEGSLLEAQIKYNAQAPLFGRPLFVGVGPVLQLADDNYTSAFFGVTEQQSTASGLSMFNAGAGTLSYGIHATFFAPITERVSLVGVAGYELLTGDAADSPLVVQRGSEDQYFGALAVSYSF